MKTRCVVQRRQPAIPNASFVNNIIGLDQLVKEHWHKMLAPVHMRHGHDVKIIVVCVRLIRHTDVGFTTFSVMFSGVSSIESATKLANLAGGKNKKKIHKTNFVFSNSVNSSSIELSKRRHPFNFLQLSDALLQTKSV